MSLFKKIICAFFMATLIAALAVSCICKPEEGNTTSKYSKVVIMYAAGFNSISSYIAKNINEDLPNGWLPGAKDDKRAFLVFSHLPKKSSNFLIETAPALFRMYRDDKNEVKMDTVLTLPVGTMASKASTVKEVLTYVKEHYDSEEYGMIFSSHGTGYLPQGYYSQKGNDESQYSFPANSASRNRARVGVPSVFGNSEEGAAWAGEDPIDPDMPMVKSVGQEQTGTKDNYVTYEMTPQEFAGAIPMHFKYIMFDACFMGGVEIAYELKNVCDILCASQAEVLAEGFDYTTITNHLLYAEESRPVDVCKAYFEQYNNQSGIYKSATISAIDCSKIDNLAKVCKDIFESNREGLDAIKPGNVQQYFRFSDKWFYDLESIVRNSGASESQMELLSKAFEDCIIYARATESFMGYFNIEEFCGLSMCLPNSAGEQLKLFYKTLSWNKATGLIP